jgi:hypothetical protein
MFQIVIVCLPPHTSHSLQPLDVGFFAPLKAEWRKILRQFFRETRHAKVDKSTFPFLLKKLCSSIKLENLRSGFLGAGLYPLNKEKTSRKLIGVTQSSNASSNDTSSPVRHIRQAIINVFSPPQSKATTEALENKKAPRKRVQHKFGEILTESETAKRLKLETEKRSEKNNKKVSQPVDLELKVVKEKSVINSPEVSEVNLTDETAIGNHILRQLVQTQKNGDCMFACLAQAIHGSQDKKTIQEVRDAAVNYVVDHWEEYSHAVYAAHNIEQKVLYKKKLLKPGTYGDHPELAALSKFHDIKVIVHTGPLFSSPQTSVENESCSRKLVRLHFYNVHYSLVKGTLPL